MSRLITFLLSAFCFLPAWAGPMDPIISGAWVGESVPGQPTATLQLNITTVKAINLLEVSSPLAESVEIHTVALRKGKVTPHITDKLKLPEHRTTPFGSRNLFLMMTGLKKTLNVGDKVPLTMRYAFADGKTKTLNAEAEVRKMELSYKHYGPNEVYDHR